MSTTPKKDDQGSAQHEMQQAGLTETTRSFGYRLMSRLVRNRMAAVGMLIVAAVVLVALLAPYIAPYNPNSQNLLYRLKPPSAEHWMGTDELGRDILSRLMFGARISLLIGILGTLGGMVVGVALGLFSGYFGGWFDNLTMRVIDIMMSFPGVLLAILIVSIMGPSTLNLVVALAIWRIPTFARVSRSSVLSLKETEFVEAAHSLGAGTPRILVRHLFINSLSPIVVYATLSIATSILAAAGLSFLGLGVQPPTAEWGLMVSTGRQYLRDAFHVILFPGLAIFITVLSINFMGDALRDVLDPRLRT